MEREGGNGGRMRKWRKNFLILSLYPPSLSISYIKIGHILSQNVKYGIFVANVTKTEHTRYEEIILGRILCEEAPQVVTACEGFDQAFPVISQMQWFISHNRHSRFIIITMIITNITNCTYL